MIVGHQSVFRQKAISTRLMLTRASAMSNIRVVRLDKGRVRMLRRRREAQKRDRKTRREENARGFIKMHCETTMASGLRYTHGESLATGHDAAEILRHPVKRFGPTLFLLPETPHLTSVSCYVITPILFHTGYSAPSH
jgi:hypothetical protein